MRLEHINMVVRDLSKTLEFYRAAFPYWRIRGQGEQIWYGVPRKWIHFGDDYQYLTFNSGGKGDNRDLESNYLGLGHFAYVTQNLAGVIERLDEAGFGAVKTGEGTVYRKNAYFIDPNGFEIEFVEYFSDLPLERNEYV